MRERLGQLPRIQPFEYARHGPELVRLDCNEVATIPEEIEVTRFQQALHHIALNRYPDMTGLPLREALAEHWGLEPDEILLGNGSIDTLCILLLAYALATESPSPRMLFPDPSFDYYPVAARRHGYVPIAVPLTARFELDQRLLLEELERHAPAVSIFASPNNPTGNRFSEPVLRTLAARSPGAFVVDEAYADYTSHSLMPWARERQDRFVMRSFSKIGYAGLRLGALVGHRDSIAELDRVRVPWNVNAVSLALGRLVIQHPQAYRHRVRETIFRRDELFRQLQDIPGITAFPSEANFLLLRTEQSASRIFERLIEQQVLVKLVSSPGLLQDCLRVSVGTATECSRFLGALKRALQLDVCA
jgi:histidinol-phosphate aminotransferase